MDAPTNWPAPALGSTYGAMLVGVIFAAFFQGLLTVQAFHYFENFPNDRLITKLMVIAVIALDTTHLILISQATYIDLVTNWGVVAHLESSPVQLNLHLIFTAFSVSIAQAFFLERIWKFSHGKLIVILPLLILAAVPTALEIYITSQIVGDTSVAQYWKTGNEAIAMFITGAVGDFLIALTTYYYLHKERSAFQPTMCIISRAIQNVIGTGLATSMIALGSVIAHFAGPGNSFYYIAIHFQLGRTYTNALLATLNSRQSMRHIPQCHTLVSKTSDLPDKFSRNVGSSIEHSKIVCMVEQKTETDVGTLHSGNEEGSIQSQAEMGYVVYEGPQPVKQLRK